MTSDLAGGCHCGNVRIEVQLTRAPESYSPRVCDCDFCRKHAAAWVSDPEGSLRIRVQDPAQLGKYRQGSDTAECLLCSRCGVLVGVVYSSGEGTFGAINERAIDGEVRFSAETPVSPRKLAVGDKVERWKKVWFRNVTIQVGDLP